MELKERIIDSASNLFFKNGIKSMTMSDIANELGISKRTLYEVFRDKEELLEVCMNDRMVRAGREIEALAHNSEDNVIDAMMRVYAKHLNQMTNLNKTVIHDLKKYHPHIYKKMECKQKEDISSFIPMFERGLEQGLIRNDINFEILLWLLKSQFKSLLEDDFIPAHKYSMEEFIRVIILNFTRGIATPAGNEKIDMIMERLKN